MNILQLTTLCYGQCPPTEPLFNLTLCLSCPVAIPYCANCSSAFVCAECLSGFITTTGNASCECPVRFVLNITTSACDNCPFDCYTCNITGECLTCSSVLDFRQLNTTTNRCVPMEGYYETNVSVAGWCSSNCKECISGTVCTLCYPRYYVDAVQACSSCPYDCYTCDSNGNCLSCSSSDYRVLDNSNASNVRCIPQNGYYESSVSVSAQCPEGCSSCTSASFCSACSEGYNLESNSCSAVVNLLPLWIVMVIVFVIVAIIIIVCVKRKCKRNEAVEPSKVIIRESTILFFVLNFSDSNKKNQ